MKSMALWAPQVNYNGAPRRMTAVCLGSKCDAVSLWWFVMSGLAQHNWSKPSKTPWLMVLQVKKKSGWRSDGVGINGKHYDLYGNHWEFIWESLATSRQAFESRAAQRGLEMFFWSWDTCHGQSKWSRLCLKIRYPKILIMIDCGWISWNINIIYKW